MTTPTPEEIKTFLKVFEEIDTSLGQWGAVYRHMRRDEEKMLAQRPAVQAVLKFLEELAKGEQ